MTMDDDREVIEVDFKPRDADLDIGLRIKSRHFDRCRHERTVIDEELRTVECKDCGASLDPVEVLIGWAREWGRYADSVKSLRAEVARRSKELDDLTRKRNNIKAQLRRAERKQGGAP
jgi:hypothetical protein